MSTPIVYRAENLTCRRCGKPVKCIGRYWCRSAGKTSPTVAVDCETGEEIWHCPNCYKGGRWWEG